MSEEAILQFIGTTGSSREEAKQLLTICGGNVSLAVECFLDQQGPTPQPIRPEPVHRMQPYSRSHESSKRPRSKVPNPLPTPMTVDDDDVRAPIEGRTERIVEDQLRVGRFNKKATSVFDGSRDVAAEFRHNPVASKKLRGLAELFKPPTDITFTGTLEQAKKKGKERGLWLLVNVQEVGDFQCQVLNRDLWSNKAVREIISQHFLLWQLYRDSLEGQHMTQFYHCHASPFIGVIDPGTGELIRSWGFMKPPQFIQEVSILLSEHPVPGSPLSPPSKRKCTKERLPLTERSISPVILDSSDDEAVSFSFRPVSSTSNSSTASSSKTETSEQSTDPSEKTIEGVTIKNGIINDTRTPSVTDTTPAVIQPGDCHVVFRLPNGSRMSHGFRPNVTCNEVFQLMDKKGYKSHALVSHFPKVGLNRDGSCLKDVLGGMRVTLFVEDNSYV